MPRYLTEFIGTYFLVAIIGFCVVDNALHQTPVNLAPIAIGLGLMAMVYMGGHVSGAHYNPAVTIAVLIRGKIAWPDVIPYILAQLLGAFAAAASVYWLLGETFAPAPAATVTVSTALIAEAIFTFALVIVILNVATAPKLEGNSFYGAAIGLTVTAGAYAVGPLSGAAFNPAVGVGPTLVKMIWGGGNVEMLWIYLAGPILGGVLAAVAFRLQNPDT